MSYPRSGREAECYIAELLEQQRWQILARNWRRRGCELDIVAWKDDLLVIIEVKYRARFLPLAADIHTLLSSRKISALTRGALSYISSTSLPPYRCIRLDLAVVMASSMLEGENPKAPRVKVLYYDNIKTLSG